MVVVLRRSVLTVAALSLLVLAAPARAAVMDAEPSVRLTSPWAVRAEVNLASTKVLGNDASSFGVSVGRSIGDWLGADLLLGYAGTGDRSSGYTVMATGRAAVVQSATGRHALTLGAGPLVIFGGGWGTVPFVHTEAAYELRWPRGVTALVGGGLDVALADSRTPPAHGAWLFAPEPFERGETGLHIRVALGWSF
jgi:hypothetical protein